MKNQPHLPSRRLLGVMVLGFLAIGCTKSPPPAPPPSPVAEAPVVPAAPAPTPIRMEPLAAVMLQPGGQATAELQVAREGNQGPIQVVVEGLPQGVTASAAEIPAEQSVGQIVLTAAESLGDEALTAMLTVKARTGSLEASQPLSVTIPKLNLPTFQPVSPLALSPGATAIAQVAIERNGYEGPLEPKLESLPAKVTGKAPVFAADQSEASLEIAAAPDAADANGVVRVVATYLGRSISVDVPVRVEARPFEVKSFTVVQIKPGETKTVPLPIERRSHTGALDVQVVDLPEGVIAAPVQVAAGQNEVVLKLAAAPEAKERVRSVKVVASAGALSRTSPMVLRVWRGEGGYLSPEVLADREAFPLVRRGAFVGRMTTKAKQALLDAYGGTPESEAAVLRGLRWLAAHQQEDGRWSLRDYSANISGCDCKLASETEVVDADTAGTAFGVLPFLASGVTHKSAPDSPPELAQFQKTVEKGLAYLVKNQVVDRDPLKTGNLGGNLYAHVIGTMALCEAYAMSGDEELRLPAQLAVKYISEAQHTTGGGWRYSPRQAGDLSATSWMFLAIRNAQLSGFPLDRAPLVRAERFIDSCAAGPEEAKQSRYAYQPGQPAKLSLSAAGLLTRQYLGWRNTHPDLIAGCRYLMENLPPESAKSVGQIYYYYYATQVLHHMEDPDFDLWNHRMREHLIRTQETEGHKAGSWSPEGVDWGKQGGRLYSTALSLLTLEAYYRHLPLYRMTSRP